MDYFIPSPQNSRRAPIGGAAPVPVNPSTVPGGRSIPFPPLPPDWRQKSAAPSAARPEPVAVSAEPFLTPCEAGLPPEGSHSAYAAAALPAEDSYYKPDITPAAAIVEERAPATAEMTPPENQGAPDIFPLPGCNGGPAGELPAALLSPLFTPGLLRGHAGRLVRVELLAGNGLSERVGRLLQVGADYLLLQSAEGHHVICDLNAVKFITIVPA